MDVSIVKGWIPMNCKIALRKKKDILLNLKPVIGLSVWQCGRLEEASRHCHRKRNVHRKCIVRGLCLLTGGVLGGSGGLPRLVSR